MRERILRGLVVALLLIIVLLPIYWMVAASLKSNLEITQQATLYPHAPSFDNYRRLFSEKRMELSLAAQCVELVGALRGPEAERAARAPGALVSV